jgi:hypothetical protein
MAEWSSGWIKGVGSIGTGYGHLHVLEHNLGTTDINFKVYVSMHPDGVAYAQEPNDLVRTQNINNAYGGSIVSITPTTVSFREANVAWIAMEPDGNIGFTWHYRGTWIKIVGIASGGGTPIATKEILGVVKVGDGLSVEPDGVLSVNKVPGIGDLCKLSTDEGAGYQMLSNGLTIQWVSSEPFLVEGVQTVNFPIPFSSRPFEITTSTRNPSGNILDKSWIQVTSSDENGVNLISQSSGTHGSIVADIIAIGITEAVDCPTANAPGEANNKETKISELTSAIELKGDDLFVISRENTGDDFYDISHNVTLANLASFMAADPDPTPAGIVHFSSKIISNAFTSTESKAFVDDASSDITAAGVYEIQSTYAFELYLTSSGYRYTKLDPNRAGDGWTSPTLGKAVRTVAKQDLKSMAIPAGTTVKFSLDWTHLGATYAYHNYTREDLIFFEITGPALIVDLSPGETLPDASPGTHLADMGITSEKVYDWYDILEYPAADQNESPRTIFNRGTTSQQDADIREPCYKSTKVNNLYLNGPGAKNAVGMWGEVVGSEQFVDGIYDMSIDSLFKLPAIGYGVAIDQRTLRNMPYTSTLIIE